LYDNNGSIEAHLYDTARATSMPAARTDATGQTTMTGTTVLSDPDRKVRASG
jgi:hypothetical protein